MDNCGLSSWTTEPKQNAEPCDDSLKRFVSIISDQCSSESELLSAISSIVSHRENHLQENLRNVWASILQKPKAIREIAFVDICYQSGFGVGRMIAFMDGLRSHLFHNLPQMTEESISKELLNNQGMSRMDEISGVQDQFKYSSKSTTQHQYTFEDIRLMIQAMKLKRFK